MVNKIEFFKQVDELILSKGVGESDYQMLYQIVIGNKINVDSSFLVDKIVSDLFGVYNELLIPWSFLQTEVGRALLKAKFEIGNDIYFISDLTELTGLSKQYIGKEVKLGNIKSERRGEKGGNIIFREDAVNEYLEKKGLRTLSDRNLMTYKEEKEKLNCGKFERECKYGEDEKS